jgi:hypothetical protein
VEYGARPFDLNWVLWLSLASGIAWLFKKRQLIASQRLYTYLFLLALPALCGSLYWWHFYFPHTIAGQNRLDDVLGEAELVLGAEYNISAASLSPDGQWIALGTNQATMPRLALFNQDTLQYHPLIELEEHFSGTPLWLDNNHFTNLNGTFVVRVSDFDGWSVRPIDEEFWQDVDHVYAVLDFDRAFLVSTDPTLPYRAYKKAEELPDVLANIPYSAVERVRGIAREDRVYSPDGRYYMATVFFEDPTRNYRRRNGVAMYNAITHQEVAHAHKWDWNSYEMGWTPDSSGFYILFAPQGEYLDSSKERHPIYRLLTPDASSSTVPIERESIT